MPLRYELTKSGNVVGPIQQIPIKAIARPGDMPLLPEALRAELGRHACNTCHISIRPSEACDVLEGVARVDNNRCSLNGSGDDPPCPRAHDEQNIDRNLHEVTG